MRSRISIRGCVRPSVGPSVRRSVRSTGTPSRRILCHVSGLVFYDFMIISTLYPLPQYANDIFYFIALVFGNLFWIEISAFLFFIHSFRFKELGARNSTWVRIQSGKSRADSKRIRSRGLAVRWLKKYTLSWNEHDVSKLIQCFEINTMSKNRYNVPK